MIKILFAAIVFLTQTSIYDHQVTGANGSEIDFDNFRGKKILLVNIATNSPKVSQIGELQQLHEQYGDSLVIVAFPSNSFGNESRTNSQIQQFCQSEYSTEFLIAAKGSVKGEDIQPLFHWLTTKTENGVFGNEIKNDFQKYLFDRNGNAIGVFSGGISPLNYQLINAITGTQN